MLKKRVTAALVIKDGIVVQSSLFKKYLPVGKPEIAMEFLNSWGIDEIILMDISATKSNTSIDVDLVKRAASKCMVPVTAAGGITTLKQVDELIHTGADKVCVNHAVFHNPSLVTDIAHKYGDQSVIVAVDVIKDADGNFNVYDYVNKSAVDKDISSWIKHIESLGAGEILVNAVHKDGTYSGFDLELINLVTRNTKTPVIAMGGAGNAADFIDLFQNTTVDAGCAGNFFHFTEHSVTTVKANLIKKNIPVRLETHANYKENDFDSSFRLKKKTDSVLEEMLFEKIIKEVI